ncbi:MAG: hypothetical protein GTN68_02405 [Candidatus Aminicenantes bacterium]|nr:hypothetical protein [Candidatus Aminicenantes bacterium]
MRNCRIFYNPNYNLCIIIQLNQSGWLFYRANQQQVREKVKKGKLETKELSG